VDEKSLQAAERKGATASRGSKAAGRRFPRSSRLLRRAEYDAVYSEGRRRSGREFTIFLRPNGLDITRFGWSIKKALGNAVWRNRIRRRLREILRLHRGEIAQGWDIVIHPRNSAGKVPFSELTVELLKLMPRAEAAQESNGGKAQ
jgi:ribonuclease P protein component